MTGGGVEYRVLGRLEVVRDGASIDLGAHRQRALMARLLIDANTVVSTDTLLDDLWGPDEGPSRQNALWVYVSGLRSALEPGRAKRTDGTIVLTRSPGYVVEVDSLAVDAVRFERMLAEGRILAETDPAAASLVLGEALALWRGSPYEEFAYESFAQREITRLEELRLEAVEARVDADLARGLGRELVSGLEALVAQHPLREWPTGQLMHALYRAGRQAEALRTFAALRDRLGTELGVEPSARLRRLEEQIVVSDPALDGQGGSVVTGTAERSGLAVRGYELRDMLAEAPDGELFRAFQPAVGREVDIRVLGPEYADDPAFVRRFDHDARSTALLEHPHIVPVYDHWREPGAAYVVTRAMTAGTLADVLDARGLRPDEVARLVDQIGSALQAYHRAGLAHGSVSAASIAIDDDLNAYLAEPSLVRVDRGTPAADTRALVEVAAQALSGLTGDIEQIRGALPPSVRDIVDESIAMPEPADPESFGNSLRAALSVQEAATDWSAEVANPYKGLRPFAFSDADTFFGRERLIERLVSRVALPGAKGRFIAVVGPSGSGKSSVVRAGLLPAIRSGAAPGSEQWFTASMAPAPHPFEALEEALTAIAINPPASLLDVLVEDNGLHRVLQRMLPDDGSQVVLLIDQFEELFTQADPQTTERFLAVLVDAITCDGSRLHVVATLRADFYDRPLRHRDIGELLREGTEVITPMRPEELERAITGPADAIGVQFEPGLVAQLVSDVVDRPGALPLLQYALTELFELRRGRVISAAAYQQLGGVSGALVARAESLLAGLGTGADDVARQVFLRLVTMGDGADDTRRRVLRSELDALPIDPSKRAALLESFGRHRLLSFDRDPVTRGPTVEISHESLLHRWDRLRGWIEAARDDVRTQRRLAEALGEWLAAERDDGYLVRGGRLAQLADWAVSTDVTLSSAEQDYLTRSEDAQTHAREAELDAQRRARAAEERARRRTRLLTLAGLSTVVVAGLAIFGLTQWRSAEAARTAALDAQAVAEMAQAESDALVRAAELTAQAEALLSSEPELALQIATEAVRATELAGYATGEAVDAVHWALHELGVQYDVDGTSATARRFGPRGPVGVWALEPATLLEFASSATTYELTIEDCQRYLGGACPAERPLPDELPLRSGPAAYDLDRQVSDGAERPGVSPLAGTEVRVMAPVFDGNDGFTAEMARFTELTGVEIVLVNSTEADLDIAATGSFDRSDAPDVVIALNSVPTWAQRRALDLETFLDVAQLTEDFGRYLTELGTFARDNGSDREREAIRAIPVQGDLKGMVFYAKEAFDAAGYEIPATFDELLRLADTIVANGSTPFCFGFQSGLASGWPGTDLIENMVLRTAGADRYAAWHQGRVPFSDPDVLRAGQLAEALLSGPGYVHGGRTSISGTGFADGLRSISRRDPLTGRQDPDCLMFIQSHFVSTRLPIQSEFGVDVDFFMLPPLTAGEEVGAVGNAQFAAALVDRPEVRALLEFMSVPDWGRAWAADVDDQFLPVNQRTELGMIGCDANGQCERGSAVDHRRRIATVVTTAVRNDAFRFDGSDLMPGRIGGVDEPGPALFWSGMLEWANGTKTIEQVFDELDAAWDELGRPTSS